MVKCGQTEPNQATQSHTGSNSAKLDYMVFSSWVQFLWGTLTSMSKQGQMGPTGPNEAKRRYSGPMSANEGQPGPTRTKQGLKWCINGPNGANWAKRSQSRPNRTNKGHSFLGQIVSGTHCVLGTFSQGRNVSRGALSSRTTNV